MKDGAGRDLMPHDFVMTDNGRVYTVAARQDPTLLKEGIIRLTGAHRTKLSIKSDPERDHVLLNMRHVVKVTVAQVSRDKARNMATYRTLIRPASAALHATLRERHMSTDERLKDIGVRHDT